MRLSEFVCFLLIGMTLFGSPALAQTSPDQIKFTRQASKRLIFDAEQTIPLAGIWPEKIIGLSVMHPSTHHLRDSSKVSIKANQLTVQSQLKTETDIWFGGFNPVATYALHLDSSIGKGALGFSFSGSNTKEKLTIKLQFNEQKIKDARLHYTDKEGITTEQSIAVNLSENTVLKGTLYLQMLGSGLVLYLKDEELPQVIGQSDFNTLIDLRKKEYLHSFQSHLYVGLDSGEVKIDRVLMGLTAGVGLADIRAITYEDGSPLLDQGRLWYTMSIRGRALPHHIQGVFSMNPSVFDIKLEGVILFDRKDGLLRNEVASHIFFDRNDKVWKGTTTGFSAYANIDKEEKQLLAVKSERDPRFGFSVMEASPFGVVGDVEDPHILYDSEVGKWRILTCVNEGGYKAIVMESDHWNKGYVKIAGPVAHNSTGTSIQKIGDRLYCFSGSSEREIFIYSYPDLKEVGTLKMDLPPWDKLSGTRVWPNVVQLPEGYPFRYVALMMDRINYPGMAGPNWTYGALYLYHGY
ncbi:hypothetical protein [Cyclobacterium amurskyense]|uniref:Uncharacterized protein n=1 Tax=Cyclobacterium amurskyense TaxID=320787 RepID=A0A0H4P824_9BACT|nr:hypothetical protein [Cyclobacterium amurskyense]AKP50601.1 hypothetical protein CA2015_1152 [Cyclobacterium amurskyense]